MKIWFCVISTLVSGSVIACDPADPSKQAVVPQSNYAAEVIAVESESVTPASTIALAQIGSEKTANASFAVEKKSDSMTATTVMQQGMRVFVDPETGKITSAPSEEAFRELNEAAAANPEMNQSDLGLIEKPMPQGGFTKDLQGRFQSTITMHVDAKGNRHVTCDEPAHRGLSALQHDAAHGDMAQFPTETNNER